MYEKYIDKDDLVSIKEFINKLDKTNTTIEGYSPIIKSKNPRYNYRTICHDDKVFCTINFIYRAIQIIVRWIYLL